jgi:hypothetical protein
VNKYAELLLEAALLGHIKKADLDPMILFGLLGGAAGAGTSALKTMTGEQPQQGAGVRALRAGVLGAGLGAAGAGGLKMMGVNPKLPKIIDTKKDKNVPASASVGVGLLGAGALGAAGKVDRSRAANRTLSANADVLQGVGPGPVSEATTRAEQLRKELPGASALPLRVQTGKPGLLRQVMGMNEHGHNLEKTLLEHLQAQRGAGNAAKTLELERLLKSLRTTGPHVARSGSLGRLGLKGLLGGGAATGLVHYMLNRDKK